ALQVVAGAAAQRVGERDDAFLRAVGGGSGILDRRLAEALQDRRGRAPDLVGPRVGAGGGTHVPDAHEAVAGVEHRAAVGAGAVGHAGLVVVHLDVRDAAGGDAVDQHPDLGLLARAVPALDLVRQPRGAAREADVGALALR